MTRGDGGQNLIGDEQGIELGIDKNTGIISRKKNRWRRAVFYPSL